MKKTIWLLILAFISAGCNDDCVPEPTPNEQPWKRFIGTYHVTKLENSETYYLQLMMDSSEVEPSGRVIYKMLWLNFDDSFDTLYNQYIHQTNPDVIDGFNAPFGVTDYGGYMWSLSMLSQDTLTPEPENTLINDTILFYFRKSNIAFYFEDGVPYYDCHCKHLAVKIE